VKQHLLAFGLFVLIGSLCVGFLAALLFKPGVAFLVLTGGPIIVCFGLIYSACYIEAGSWLRTRKRLGGGRDGI
jgi:hypothetical protein